MNYRMMGKFISRILLVEAVFMLPALLIAVYHGEEKTIFGFLTGMVITLAVALLLYLFCRKALLCERRFGLCGRKLDYDESFGMSPLLFFTGNSSFYRCSF